MVKRQIDRWYRHGSLSNSTYFIVFISCIKSTDLNAFDMILFVLFINEQILLDLNLLKTQECRLNFCIH